MAFVSFHRINKTPGREKITRESVFLYQIFLKISPSSHSLWNALKCMKIHDCMQTSNTNSISVSVFGLFLYKKCVTIFTGDTKWIKIEVFVMNNHMNWKLWCLRTKLVAIGIFKWETKTQKQHFYANRRTIHSVIECKNNLCYMLICVVFFSIDINDRQNRLLDTFYTYIMNQDWWQHWNVQTNYLLQFFIRKIVRRLFEVSIFLLSPIGLKLDQLVFRIDCVIQ